MLLLINTMLHAIEKDKLQNPPYSYKEFSETFLQRNSDGLYYWDIGTTERVLERHTKMRVYISIHCKGFLAWYRIRQIDKSIKILKEHLATLKLEEKKVD